MLVAAVVIKLDTPDMSNVSACYHDLREVFSKTRATTLPSHRPYDFSIDLLPGTSPPRGRLYSLSASETEAMREYIQSSLCTGIIWPLSSPSLSPFIFVSKKDRSMQSCIDYRGLKNTTIKNRYPLLLISSAFECLQQAKGTISWEMEQRVLQAQDPGSLPEGCLPHQLFILAGHKSAVIQWAHASSLSCQSGVQKTLSHLHQRFW